MKNLKLKMSTKLLDFVEGLPRFRKGTISSLQNIRESQRKRSDCELENLKIPDKAQIKLKQMTLVLTFEHEDFNKISRGLKKYFVKNKTIEKFTKALKESENSIHVSSGHNLGYIVKKQSRYLFNSKVDQYLPECVKHVSISSHRILPSIACIIFDFSLEEVISEKLNALQSKPFLGSIIFNNFWPPGKIHFGYSIEVGHSATTEAIRYERDLSRLGIEKWIKNSFKWNSDILKTASYIDVYKIDGNPKDRELRNKWVSKYRSWLNCYGLTINDLDFYEGADILLSKPEESKNSLVSDIVVRVDSNENCEFDDFLEYKVRAVAISSTIFNVVKKYQYKVEDLRGKGFENLYQSNKFTLNSPSNIQDLKRTVVILSRLEHEFEQSGHWIEHQISEIGELRSSLRQEDINFGRNTIENSKYHLKQVKDAADIIDVGLTNYLSIQSIYVMYKLQKWMFILSIVVTIATMIGVLSGWENIKKFFIPLNVALSHYGVSLHL